MKPPLTTALSESEQDRLQAILARVPGAMNLEGLDGFFAALIAGPELIMPSEYLPVVWGRDAFPDEAFATANDAEAFMQLSMRHWNSIVSDLDVSVHVPLVFERDDSRPEGADWARGFMRGVSLRRRRWADLIQDDEKGGAILPIALMSGEVDPKWPKKPLSAKKQEEIIAMMGAGLVVIYRYYLERRADEVAQAASSRRHRRASPKTGRNEPCPCGSGRKFKVCCGAAGG